MFRKLLLSVTILATVAAGTTFADSLSGTILHKDGSKVKKTARVSTSWNSETATYPADGEYKIDFKGKVGKRITVYVNGDKYTEIEVRGDTTLNIRLTK